MLKRQEISFAGRLLALVYATTTLTARYRRVPSRGPTTKPDSIALRQAYLLDMSTGWWLRNRVTTIVRKGRRTCRRRELPRKTSSPTQHPRTPSAFRVINRQLKPNLHPTLLNPETAPEHPSRSKPSPWEEFFRCGGKGTGFVCVSVITSSMLFVPRMPRTAVAVARHAIKVNDGCRMAASSCWKISDQPVLSHSVWPKTRHRASLCLRKGPA